MEKPLTIKGTTTVSLNDRFTKLIKARPKALQQNLQKQPSALSQAQKASARNRRLALQMENRPAVRAALGLKQRLGTKPVRGGIQQGGAKSRLGVIRGRGGRARILTRGGRQNLRGNRRGRLAQTSVRGGVRRTYNVRGARGRGWGLREGRGRGLREGRGRGLRGRRGTGLNNNRQGNRMNQNQGQGQRGQIVSRGGRGRGRGMGRGRGRGRGGNTVVSQTLSKEDLDNQLDAYMSNTRTSLDAELDAYMADTT